jgi:uncharacterized protein (TIGR01244 family)
MINFRQLTTHIAIAGQPTAEELSNARPQGFRTVVNLRTEPEAGYLHDEERIVEDTGIYYTHIPVSPATLDDLAVERFSQALSSEDSAPALVHCQGGGRAGVMVLLHLAIQNGWSLEETLAQDEALGGIAPKPDSPYRPFFESFIRRHSAGER